MMYYIFTAVHSTRTAPWLESLEEGLEQLKAVVIDDKLSICEELDRRMQHLVDSYRCEWAEVVNDPEKQKRFRQFVNSGDNESTIEFIPQREQTRPADWPKGGVPSVQLSVPDLKCTATELDPKDSKTNHAWVKVGVVDDFPIDGGSTIKYGKVQIAVYNVASRGEWLSFVSKHVSSHERFCSLALESLAMLPASRKLPAIARPFSLKSGKCMSGEGYAPQIFPSVSKLAKYSCSCRLPKA